LSSAGLKNFHLNVVPRAHKSGSASLRLSDFDRADLANSRLFANAQMSVIDELISSCPVVPLRFGELLISDREPCHALYVVLEGRMKVYRDSNQNTPDRVIEAGDYIGEVSLIDERPVCANVVADTDARVVAINRDTFWGLIRASHAVACNLLATIARRLRDNGVGVSSPELQGMRR
jgi:CRP-like cAMP-binding protein